MATSFPTASSLGILANGTDQTSALNTALSNSSYAGIIFDYSPPAAVTINGSVTATGKVLQFLNGSYLTGSGTLNGGFINAPYDAKIWDTTLLVKPQGTTGKYYSLRWSGAIGDGATDDWAAMQNDINICTYNGLRELYLPTGTYRITKGLLFRKDNGGQYQGLTPSSISTAGFLSGINLTGDGIAYDGASGQTSINCANANSFAIGLQKVKGFACKGIYCTGVNTGLNNYTSYQVMEDPSSTFLTNSSRDNINSPHCGMNIDPFGSSSTPSSNMYPDFTGYYVETSSAGSTEVTFEDCVFRYFTVGRVVSINGTLQNGEIVKFGNCWADYNKVSLATGQAQSRSVVCNNDHVWAATMVIYDGRTYGNNEGCPVTSIGLNAAGAVRYLSILSGWISNGLVVKDAHIESMWSLGGNFTNVNGNLRVEDSWINLVGSNHRIGVTPPYSIFNGGTLKITNSYLTNYGADVAAPLSVNCLQAIFEDVFFDFIPINNYGFGITSFKNCFCSSSFGDSDFIGWNFTADLTTSQPLFTTGMKAVLSNGSPGAPSFNKERRKISSIYDGILTGYGSKAPRDVIGAVFSTTVTLTSVTYSTLSGNTAQFSLSTSSVDYKNLMVGDNLLFYTTDEFGNTTALTYFGQVTAISSGTITLGGIAKNLNTTTAYQLFIYRNQYLIPQLILGNVTSGSNVVSNVLIETGTSNVPANVPVYIPHFPLGTYIVSYSSGTAQLTLSNNATITENNVAILSSNWIGEETGGFPNLGNPYNVGYKKGDKIYNSRTDLYPNIVYWECTKSGITNMATLPEFVSYDGTESTTYTASSVTAATADANKIVFLNATANSIVYTINPAAFKNLNQSLFGIIPGANTITITPSSGTINGAASYSLTNNQCIKVYSDGTNLFIVSKS
ncbi:hypothetical protein [Puia dinghuensis]|uniref:Pectate lyase superfamily protein domain-containing protein n=1 Tax=Puia dinghuensis TaxID=1792502 RepID=A0A8J2U895_9BACT|nr:hypothetical protein [Puia dinghuensis]GGA85224.1 hypothetical protein GCM10011511_05320 [Puia dinghuensis]